MKINSITDTGAGEPEPPLKSWRNMYLLVLGNLFLLILLFCLLTDHYQ
jgi:hypothetical protein